MRDIKDTKDDVNYTVLFDEDDEIPYYFKATLTSEEDVKEWAKRKGITNYFVYTEDN